MLSIENTSEIIEKFRDLESQYRHPPRKRGCDKKASARFRDERKLFQQANIELYYLAQRICDPGIQRRLNVARTEVIRALGIIELGGTIFLMPRKLRRPVRWCEYVLTPEIEGNLALSGTRVTRNLAVELEQAHRAQIKCIREVCGI